MFKFLKNKLKKVVDKFSKKVDEEAEEKKEEIIVEEPKVEEKKEVVTEEKIVIEKEIEEPKVEEKVVEKAEIKKEEPIFKEVDEIIEAAEEKAKEPEIKEETIVTETPKKIITEKVIETIKETPKEKIIEKKEIITEESKRGFFGKIKQVLTTKKINEKKFDELFWDLELALLENNTALEVIEKIKKDMKKVLVDKPVPKGHVEELITSTLRYSIDELFMPNYDLVQKIKESDKKPYVICFVGINGSGKTTTIAKVAHLLKKNGLSVVLAAADTFRAAAIDQLQIHGDKLGVKVIKHDYGSDPAAVAFDAVKHAESTKKDVVLIDTAGRIHSNTNLMAELEKIVRVSKPDLKLFVGESITGNDCTEQAKKFDDAIRINGIILSKADVDDKGGAAISVSFVTRKPILYLGTGQEYDDLQLFNKEDLLKSIGL